jgi:hypothetical protein
MTLRSYEERLKSVNPNLSIKRYNGIAGVFLNDHYILRIEQGEIVPFSEYHQFTNAERLARRGRISVARMLYAQKAINQKDIAYLS